MHSFAWWPTLIALVVATSTDLRSRRIPNWLVLPFLAAGITVSGWLGGWHGIGQSIEGLALGLLLFGMLFWMGGMGAGDVKLAAAIGAWIGPMQLFFALIVTALVGGVMALGWMAMGRLFPDLLKGTGDLEVEGKREDAASGGEAIDGAAQVQEGSKKRSRVRKLPYAPAIALGTLISFFAR